MSQPERPDFLHQRFIYTAQRRFVARAKEQHNREERDKRRAESAPEKQRRKEQSRLDRMKARNA